MKQAVPGLTLLLCLFLTGCTTAPPQMIYVPSIMLPQNGPARTVQARTRLTGQSIVIAPVTGVGASNLEALSGAVLGPSPLPGKIVIWGQTFREAMFRALRDSGLFAGVLRAGPARYTLRAEILEQTAAGYGAALKVRYTLSDTQGGQDIWTEEIAATYSFALNPVTFLSPGNSAYAALMHACGNNLGLLIAKLAALPATDPGKPNPTF
jgi:hypothetical protein